MQYLNETDMMYTPTLGLKLLGKMQYYNLDEYKQLCCIPQGYNVQPDFDVSGKTFASPTLGLFWKKNNEKKFFEKIFEKIKKN